MLEFSLKIKLFLGVLDAHFFFRFEDWMIRLSILLEPSHRRFFSHFFFFLQTIWSPSCLNITLFGRDIVSFFFLITTPRELFCRHNVPYQSGHYKSNFTSGHNVLVLHKLSCICSTTFAWYLIITLLSIFFLFARIASWWLLWPQQIDEFSYAAFFL